MNVTAIPVDPEPSVSTSMAVTSASVLLEPRETPTLAVGSRTSARQAHVDSTPSAGVREAHLGKILSSFISNTKSCSGASARKALKATQNSSV